MKWMKSMQRFSQSWNKNSVNKESKKAPSVKQPHGIVTSAKEVMGQPPCLFDLKEK